MPLQLISKQIIDMQLTNWWVVGGLGMGGLDCVCFSSRKFGFEVSV